MNLGPAASKAFQSSLAIGASSTGNRATSPFAHPLTGIAGRVSRLAVAGWRWVEGKRTQQLASRRMRVAETVSLGEKRFVSIIQVDGTQFLVGGAANQVNLLAVLSRSEESASDPHWNKVASSEVLS